MDQEALGVLWNNATAITSGYMLHHQHTYKEKKDKQPTKMPKPLDRNFVTPNLSAAVFHIVS